MDDTRSDSMISFRESYVAELGVQIQCSQVRVPAWDSSLRALDLGSDRYDCAIESRHVKVSFLCIGAQRSPRSSCISPLLLLNIISIH